MSRCFYGAVPGRVYRFLACNPSIPTGMHREARRLAFQIVLRCRIVPRRARQGSSWSTTPDGRELVAEYLTFRAFTVDCANDGAHAIEMR